ncbi:MAG: YfiR/HmsC family protein [candidate division Zixibacteria bacterium]
MDPKLSLPLFLKIITCDFNFNSDKFENVHIRILYDKGNADAYEEYQIACDFMSRNSDLKIEGLDIIFEGVNFFSPDSILNGYDSQNYNVLIIAGNNENGLEELLDKLSESNIRTFSFNPELISNGIAVSVKAQEKKNSIIVNLDAAQSEGSKFGAHLLKMCSIYEGAR